METERAAQDAAVHGQEPEPPVIAKRQVEAGCRADFRLLLAPIEKRVALRPHFRPKFFFHVLIERLARGLLEKHI